VPDKNILPNDALVVVREHRAHRKTRIDMPGKFLKAIRVDYHDLHWAAMNSGSSLKREWPVPG